MDEIEKIKRLINKLEDRIEELEIENRALKMSIKQACTSLMRQNDDAKKQLKNPREVTCVCTYI